MAPAAETRLAVSVANCVVELGGGISAPRVEPAFTAMSDSRGSISYGIMSRNPSPPPWLSAHRVSYLACLTCTDRSPSVTNTATDPNGCPMALIASRFIDSSPR
jgi:hypothetical protein